MGTAPHAKRPATPLGARGYLPGASRRDLLPPAAWAGTVSCNPGLDAEMPTMTISWPIDAIVDPAAIVQRVVRAVESRPGGSVEAWCEHRPMGDRIVTIRYAKFTVESDEHLLMIQDAITAIVKPALEVR